MNAKHRARKRFGQNFLHDPHIIHQIIDAIHCQKDEHIVEIGPGLGAITDHLITQCMQLDVVELDRDLVPRLEARFSGHDHFSLHQGDALKFDYGAIAGTQPLRVVGNLPYNISTPLLFHLFSFIDGIQDMHFMLQKEVVQRMCASENSKNYGRLSIMTQLYCNAELLFLVPPGAFSPPPKVESAIVRLTPKDGPRPVSPEHLNQVATAAFNLRRKTIRNGFKQWLDEADYEALHINPGLRPENLSLDDFVRITQYIFKTQAH